MFNLSDKQHYKRPGHTTPGQPFDHLQIDFIALTQCERKEYCLVAVDMFSKWVEVFPTGKADASAVAKVLVREIIPPLGIPHKIKSDDGPHFVNNANNQLSTFFRYQSNTALHLSSTEWWNS